MNKVDLLKKCGKNVKIERIKQDLTQEQLAEIIEFLKDPGKFTAVGARIHKGVLLEGPPGIKARRNI